MGGPSDGKMREKELWPARTGPARAEPRNATVGYCAQTVRFELPLLWYPSVAMIW